MALRYAEKFILNPNSIDDAFWAKLNASFTEGEIVELSFINMTYNGLHRFNAIIDLEPTNPYGLTTVQMPAPPGRSG
jgi:alkylhydroperoxidase family enzyme